MTSPAPQLSKIVPGRTQFGMDYGIAATKGRLSGSAHTEILDAAWASDVRMIDTARDCGDAERRIGHTMLDRSLVEAAFSTAADVPFEAGRPQFWSELARVSSAQAGASILLIHPEK